MHDSLHSKARSILESSKAVEKEVKPAPEPLVDGDVLTLGERESSEEWLQQGWQLLASGRAAVLLLAGGQGTRLGSSKPKGCFDISLPSSKSLFHIQAERLLKLQQLATCHSAATSAAAHERPTHATHAQLQQRPEVGSRAILWYIMTSPATHEATVEHFREAAFFGLLESQVYFFSQAVLPCLTEQGELIRQADASVATAPDGNGGVYAALKATGALRHMLANGVECVDCYSVDNALARLGDPLFLGVCHSRAAEVGARVVPKASAEEKVGVFARRAGRLQVVEYSELSPEEACVKNGGGEMLYNWGNICMHYFSVAWLARVIEELEDAKQYHIARKSIPSADGTVPGIKLEQFIFDPFPRAANVVLLEVERSKEFAPVKNASGAGVADSPETARLATLALHRRWVEEAGGRIIGDEGLEVAPLLSYGGEGLEGVCAAEVVFQSLSHVAGSHPAVDRPPMHTL